MSAAKKTPPVAKKAEKAKPIEVERIYFTNTTDMIPGASTPSSIKRGKHRMYLDLNTQVFRIEYREADKAPQVCFVPMHCIKRWDLLEAKSPQ